MREGRRRRGGSLPSDYSRRKGCEKKGAATASLSQRCEEEKGPREGRGPIFRYPEKEEGGTNACRLLMKRSPGRGSPSSKL